MRNIFLLLLFIAATAQASPKICMMGSGGMFRDSNEFADCKVTIALEQLGDAKSGVFSHTIYSYCYPFDHFKSEPPFSQTITGYHMVEDSGLYEYSGKYKQRGTLASTNQGLRIFVFRPGWYGKTELGGYYIPQKDPIEFSIEFLKDESAYFSLRSEGSKGEDTLKIQINAKNTAACNHQISP